MNAKDQRISKPLFGNEKVLELIRLIVRMNNSREAWHRLIWVEGNDWIAKNSFAEYLRYLVNSDSSEIAFKNIEQVIRDKNKDDVDYQESLLGRHQRLYNFDNIILASVKKENLTELKSKENTLFVLNETQCESQLSVSEDILLLEFIQRLSEHNNWFLWVSDRPKDNWHPDEADMRAIKIRDHESFAIVRLNKTEVIV